MNWLLADTQRFDLFSDYNNLIYIFDPTSVVTDISQPPIRKVLRWAIRLSVYNCNCVHINGEDNVWADLLGRWSAPPPTIGRLVHIPALVSSSPKQFDWPNADQLFKTQQEVPDNERPSFIVQDKIYGSYRTEENSVSVSESNAELQLRLCIIAHTGPAGHRAQRPTLDYSQEGYFWANMAEDVNSFVSGCIDCLSTRRG